MRGLSFLLLSKCFGGSQGRFQLYNLSTSRRVTSVPSLCPPVPIEQNPFSICQKYGPKFDGRWAVPPETRYSAELPLLYLQRQWLLLLARQYFRFSLCY